MRSKVLQVKVITNYADRITNKRVKPYNDLIANQVLTTCTLWEIIRLDGVRLGFTDFDRDLFTDNLLFLAQPGLTKSAISSNNNLESPTNAELTTAFDSNLITVPDLLAGKYDYGRVNIYLANYLNPSQRMLLASGYIGETRSTEISCTAEFRSFSQKLDQQIGELTSEECRAEFCAPDCGLNIANFTRNLTVTSSVNNSVFAVDGNHPNDRFTRGHLRFTSGANDGFKSVIKSFTNNVITLFEQTPYVITVGDAIVAVDGCDKKKETCRDKYNNYLNFQGEADLPGMDEYYRGFDG